MHKHGLKARPKCDTPTFLCSLLQASSAAALSLLAARDPVVSDTLRYLGALPLLVDLLNSSHLTVTEAARCCLLSLKHNNPRNASEILACLRSNQDLCKVRPSTTAQRMCTVHAFCTTVAVNQNRPVGYCCPPNEHLLTSCLVTSQNAARLVFAMWHGRRSDSRGSVGQHQPAHQHAEAQPMPSSAPHTISPTDMFPALLLLTLSPCRTTGASRTPSSCWARPLLPPAAPPSPQHTASTAPVSIAPH